jgi:hypothetical protein
MTTLYDTDDIAKLSAEWDKITEEVESEKLTILEPSLEEQQTVLSIVVEYVKTNKRKIYGGYAQNLLIVDKNPQDAIYKPNKIADVDFYSPTPIQDLMMLCNLIHNRGFKFVVGSEAQHQETYTLSVNRVVYCDISYVPKHIYNNIPFATIQGMTVSSPNWLLIDSFRIMTDPINSYWRFAEGDQKKFRRIVLLQKYYPFPDKINELQKSIVSKEKENALDTVFNWIENKKSIVVMGYYAYNHFIVESKTKNSKIKPYQVPYFEFVSTNYKTDIMDLLDKLKHADLLTENKVTHKEYYPFFQFTDYGVEIYYNGAMIVRAYGSNKKCVQYQDVEAIQYHKNKPKPPTKNNFVRIGMFPSVLMYNLITIMIMRSIGDKQESQKYFDIIAHLTNVRNSYLKENNKKFTDNTIFKEFHSKCVGDTISPERQRMLILNERKKKNKRLTFRYEPAHGVQEPETTHIFANSSGNEINNPKNLKLVHSNNSEDNIELGDNIEE